MIFQKSSTYRWIGAIGSKEDVTFLNNVSKPSFERLWITFVKKKSKGKYAYTNELGSTIIVHYSAGANKGFVIENMDEIEEAMEEAQEAVAYAEMAIDAFSDDFFF